MMFLTIHRRRIPLDPGVWISPEEIMRRAVAAAAWPRNKIYLEWDFGHEPIHTMEELAFACRLVQCNHCRNMEYDYGELFRDDDDEMRLLGKPRIVRHRRGKGTVEEATTTTSSTISVNNAPPPSLEPHPLYLPVRCPLAAAQIRRKKRAQARAARQQQSALAQQKHGEDHHDDDTEEPQPTPSSCWTRASLLAHLIIGREADPTANNDGDGA